MTASETPSPIPQQDILAAPPPLPNRPDVLNPISEPQAKKMQDQLRLEITRRKQAKGDMVPFDGSVLDEARRSYRGSVTRTLSNVTQDNTDSSRALSDAANIVIEGEIRTGSQTVFEGNQKTPKFDLVAVGILESMAGVVNIDLESPQARRDFWEKHKAQIQKLEVIGARALFDTWRSSPPSAQISSELPQADATDAQILDSFIKLYRNSDKMPTIEFGRAIGQLATRSFIEGMSQDINKAKASAQTAMQEKNLAAQTISQLQAQLTEQNQAHQTEKQLLEQRHATALNAKQTEHAAAIQTQTASHETTTASLKAELKRQRALQQHVGHHIAQSAEFLANQFEIPGNARSLPGVEDEIHRFNQAGSILKKNNVFAGPSLSESDLRELQYKLTGFLKYLTDTQSVTLIGKLVTGTDGKQQLDLQDQTPQQQEFLKTLISTLGNLELE